MSSVLKCASSTYASVLAVTVAANSPVRRSKIRAAVAPTTRTPAKPVSAVHSRDVHSLAPNASYASAVVQYCSGGFSKYLRPFSRGVSQSPLATISRGISA